MKSCVAMFCIGFRLYIYHTVEDQLTFYTQIIFFCLCVWVCVISFFFQFIHAIYETHIWNDLRRKRKLRHLRRYLRCMVPLKVPRYRNPLPFLCVYFTFATKVVEVLSMFSPLGCQCLSFLSLVYKKLQRIRFTYETIHLRNCVLIFFSLLLFIYHHSNAVFCFFNGIAIESTAKSMQINQMKPKAKVSLFFSLQVLNHTFLQTQANGTRTIIHLNTLTIFPFTANARLGNACQTNATQRFDGFDSTQKGHIKPAHMISQSFFAHKNQWIYPPKVHWWENN